jgi:hypothetical protein
MSNVYKGLMQQIMTDRTSVNTYSTHKNTLIEGYEGGSLMYCFYKNTSVLGSILVVPTIDK